MKKQNGIPNIVYLAILTAITVVFWIFFGVYRVFTSQPAPSVSQAILEPLDPNISIDVIDSIEARIYFDESQLPQTVITSPTESPSPSPTEVPLATETPLASPSASPTEESPSPTATPTVTP